MNMGNTNICIFVGKVEKNLKTRQKAIEKNPPPVISFITN